MRKKLTKFVGRASLARFTSFCHCRVENKRRKSARMKHWQIALAIFAALSTSLALAEDFKITAGCDAAGPG
jgi:hypothetical protein